MKAFSPQQAKEAKICTLPDEVIESVNELLASNYSSSITLTQGEVIARILSKMPNVTRSAIYDNKWLDFEPVFEKEGWHVMYDKPAYNESYEANWVFKAK